MEYVGWKIFAYRYYHDQPGLQRGISKQEFLERIKQCFKRALNTRSRIVEHRSGRKCQGAPDLFSFIYHAEYPLSQ
jgi:hypothetical protein